MNLLKYPIINYTLRRIYHLFDIKQILHALAEATLDERYVLPDTVDLKVRNDWVAVCEEDAVILRSAADKISLRNISIKSVNRVEPKEHSNSWVDSWDGKLPE